MKRQPTADELRAAKRRKDEIKDTLAGMEPGTVLVDHTTASADVARELSAVAQTRGLQFIDAPVSGGQAGAGRQAFSLLPEKFDALHDSFDEVTRDASLDEIDRGVGVGDFRMCASIDDVRKRGSSVGAVIEVVASGVPLGLGDPVYDKLDADLAMQFNAARVRWAGALSQNHGSPFDLLAIEQAGRLDRQLRQFGLDDLEVLELVLRGFQPVFVRLGGGERGLEFLVLDDPALVRAIVADGCDKARILAQETMREVRDAMGLSYN